MNIYSAYSILNKAVNKVASELNYLKKADTSNTEVPFRLEEEPEVITESLNRTKAFITAHDLNQYTNHFYVVKLKDNDEIMFDKVLFGVDEDIDFKEIVGQYVKD